jgi:Tfp pilus assembly protein PilO
MNFWLMKVSEETRVPFRSGSSTTKPSPEPSNLVKVMTKATLTGDYADIRRFLYELETAQQFVIIESMELTQSGTQQAGGVLEVALEIATYYVDDKAGETSGKSGTE